MTTPSLIQTPAGASASAAGIVTLIFAVILPPVWPWWAHQTTTWTGAVQTVLIFGITYLGSWYKVIHAKDQKFTMELTPSRLPTMQSDAPAEPAAPAA